MDNKSLLGYSKGSPYRGNPYLDIFTPEGLIDMSNTDIPLYAVDNKGNEKFLSPYSGMHKFEGDMVREIPMKKGGLSPSKAKEMLEDGTAHGKKLTKKQKKYFGYIYGKSKDKKQMGGLSMSQILDFLYDDDDEDSSDPEGITAPSVNELEQALDEREASLAERERSLSDAEDDALAMSLAMGESEDYINEFLRTKASGEIPATANTNPITGAIGSNPFVNPAAAKQPVQLKYNTSPVKTSNEKTKFAMNFFKQKGLPDHVAAGIVGNLMQESGHFSESVITGKRKGDKGKATGIAQWHPDRWGSLVKWAKTNDLNPYTLEAQLEYVYKEAGDRGDLDYVMKSKHSGEAAYRFAEKYERPKNIDNQRIAYARGLVPYKQGGQYELDYDELVELKKQGYKFKLL